MITAKGLSRYLLGEPLFKEVSFVVRRGEKIGLVGGNGSGKTTLLRMILGEVEPDTGTIDIERENIGYLPQEFVAEQGVSVADFLALPDRTDASDALLKVGLEKLSWGMEVARLSGGQKTRLALAKLLLGKPSLLLLDEPTNHLDLDGITWLEGFLADFRGGVLIVSHDRRLLDTVIEKVYELDPVNKKFSEFEGGYTEYIIERKKRLELWEQAYARQQKEKRRMKLWIARKKEDARYQQDPAKGKMIRAMEKRLQREILDVEIVRPRAHKSIDGMALAADVHTHKLLLRVHDLAMSFPNKPLFKGASFELRGRERVQLSGQNGSGKSTLLKILVGELRQTAGSFRFGDGVRVGYFAQEHEVLDPNNTVQEEFLATKRLTCPPGKARSILGAFQFTGRDIEKKVAVLSLGERVRLVFAKLTHQENDVLILDEPTNHLDVQSRESIEDAIIAYRGAVLTVSHDRYFLDRIEAHRVLVVEKERIVEQVYEGEEVNWPEVEDNTDYSFWAG